MILKDINEIQKIRESAQLVSKTLGLLAEKINKVANESGSGSMEVKVSTINKPNIHKF